MTKNKTKQFFLSTETKRIIDENIKIIKGKRNLETISSKHYYIVHLIYSNRIFFKDVYRAIGVAISTQTLFTLFKNYEDGSEILNNLQEWGIISMEKNYSKGKARRYKLMPSFEDCNILVFHVKSTAAPFIKELIKRAEEAKESSNFVKAQLNILNKKVSINSDGIDFLCQIYPHLSDIFKSYSPKKPIDIPTGSIIYQRDITLVSFLTKDYFCIRPNKENRLFSNLTSLKRIYRPFLLLDGKPMIATDLVNSQLLFTVPLVENKLKEMNKRPIYVPCDDLRKFKHLAEIGKAYESISALIDFPELTGEVRKVFKEKFYSDFYFCSLKQAEDTPMNNLFKQQFPNVHAAITQMKTDEKYNCFAINCQKNESYILLDKVYFKLLKRRITALTLHDSIYVSNEKDAMVVKALIEEELFKEHKLKVTVTTKIETIDEKELNEILANPVPKQKGTASKVKKSTIREAVIEISELEVNREWISDYIGISINNDNIVEFSTFVVNLNGLLVYSKETGEEYQLSNKEELKNLIEDDFEKTYGSKLSA